MKNMTIFCIGQNNLLMLLFPSCVGEQGCLCELFRLSFLFFTASLFLNQVVGQVEVVLPEKVSHEVFLRCAFLVACLAPFCATGMRIFSIAHIELLHRVPLEV